MKNKKRRRFKDIHLRTKLSLVIAGTMFLILLVNTILYVILNRMTQQLDDIYIGNVKLNELEDALDGVERSVAVVGHGSDGRAALCAGPDDIALRFPGALAEGDGDVGLSGLADLCGRDAYVAEAALQIALGQAGLLVHIDARRGGDADRSPLQPHALRLRHDAYLRPGGDVCHDGQQHG